MQRATSTALLSEEEHHHNKTLQSLTGQVNQKRLFPVLMSFLDRPFVTRKGYRAHLYCNATGSFPPTRTTDAQGIEHLTEAWGVRSALPRYPEFPLGHVKSNKEESFLFHWVVQITLQLLTTFQERLLCPSYLENRLSSEAQTPNVEKEVIKGCVSPQEDSALASLCGGGGYYVTAVATLQFLVIRILRDALCVPATWTAVYGCSLEQWKNDETALKQIIFFFSAFLRFWSPLFTGGVRVPLDTSNTSSRASKGKPFTASRHTVSEVNVDGLASLSLLEWFTCSNILEQDSAKSTAAATAMGPIGATETPAKVATAVEDLLNRKGFLPVSPPVAVAPNKGGSVARDNAKSWRRPSEQTKERDAAVEAVTGTGSGASPVLSASSAAAVQAMLQATTNYIPDTLLKVVLHFFEEVLQEPKAISGITSEVTRGRVDRVFESINLIAYSSAEEPDSEEEVVNPADGRKLTLSDLRELLVYYLDPVL
ncbi:hypothetical protein ADEAN_000758300 [Angomonas deanei]|uniref:Uncharacterized protein n=1 Tax=Angomonas deanei TaxID=59799 RepID=A0A7G2CKX0_9TRYP|nr:hypothetical protein ADEAN_000758300 [Angomonas deanei]